MYGPTANVASWVTSRRNSTFATVPSESVTVALNGNVAGAAIVTPFVGAVIVIAGGRFGWIAGCTMNDTFVVAVTPRLSVAVADKSHVPGRTPVRVVV